MERDSLAYKIRRKMQVMASKVMPDSVMSKFYFKVVLGKKLNLKNPQTFNEKLQWLKLNYLPKNLLAHLSNSISELSDSFGSIPLSDFLQ